LEALVQEGQTLRRAFDAQVASMRVLDGSDLHRRSR